MSLATSTQNKLDLTIVIPAKNESVNLPGCLAAIGNNFAQEVVLVDSGSTDDTLKIAASHNVTVIDFKWDGKFPKKRNWYLRNYKPSTTWVLFLDADEYITEEFKTETRAALANTNKVGFWLNFTIYFMGRKLKGGYPLKKLALFRVGAGEYERIDEDQWSKLDMEIHEHPVLTGDTGVIKSKIDHRDFRGVTHYMIKHAEYASWEANRFLKSAGDPAVKSQWTFKQKLKYRLMNSVMIGPVYFLGSFFALGGYKDGARGVAFAILKMSYFTQIYCKINEKNTA